MTLLALASAATVAIVAGLIVALHLLPTGIDPLEHGVSAYANTRYGALYRAQVILTGAATLAIVVLVWPDVGELGVAALLVFAASRIAIARFPTDPPDSPSLSTAGRRHVLLATAAFLAIAIAAPAVGRRLFELSSWHGSTDALAILNIAVPVTMLATFAAGTTPPTRRIFGLVERCGYVAALAWLFVVSLGYI